MTTENPSAFPVNDANLGGPGAYAAEPGMSLRDWFAGQALAGMTANAEIARVIQAVARRHGVDEAEAMAMSCYGHADAMIEARKNGVQS
ncbi:MAG: hypothetical protein EON59_03785 [Alphaproteobacteria bacterium]|nr:MAG: hypothetical protein EON59_03785 [Alphaproteobacteria bacterium]